MRKLFYSAAAAATFLTVTGASAETFTHSVALSATVEAACAFSGTRSFAGSVTPLSGDTSAMAIDVEPTMLAHQQGSLTFANVSCNGGSTNIQLDREGLSTGGGALAGFKNKIYYKATVKWNGGADIVTLDAAANSLDTATATVTSRTGDFVLNIDVPADSGPFKAGEYEDILVLTVTPSA